MDILRYDWMAHHLNLWVLSILSPRLLLRMYSSTHYVFLNVSVSLCSKCGSGGILVV